MIEATATRCTECSNDATQTFLNKPYCGSCYNAERLLEHFNWDTSLMEELATSAQLFVGSPHLEKPFSECQYDGIDSDEFDLLDCLI